MSPYYSDEWVTLYHGDCREATEWMEADALVTDPPYGLGSIMSGGKEWSQLWGTLGHAQPLGWDKEAPDFVAEIVRGFNQAIVWGGNYFPLPLSRGWLVWDKVVRNFSAGHCELAWTSLEQPVRAFNYPNGQLANEGKVHPTQKPLPLMQWCTAFTNGVVADPFAGSGTTLLAAKNLGRKAVGVELDESYCEMAANRLKQGCFNFEETA